MLPGQYLLSVKVSSTVAAAAAGVKRSAGDNETAAAAGDYKAARLGE